MKDSLGTIQRWLIFQMLSAYTCLSTHIHMVCLGACHTENRSGTRIHRFSLSLFLVGIQSPGYGTSSLPQKGLALMQALPLTPSLYKQNSSWAASRRCHLCRSQKSNFPPIPGEQFLNHHHHQHYHHHHHHCHHHRHWPWKEV